MKDTLTVDNPGDWDSPVSSKLIKEWASAVKEGILQDTHCPRSRWNEPIVRCMYESNALERSRM